MRFLSHASGGLEDARRVSLDLYPDAIELLDLGKGCQPQFLGGLVPGTQILCLVQVAQRNGCLLYTSDAADEVVPV